MMRRELGERARREARGQGERLQVKPRTLLVREKALLFHRSLFQWSFFLAKSMGILVSIDKGKDYGVIVFNLGYQKNRKTRRKFENEARHRRRLR
jgi:hypothetical protein